MAEQVTPMRPDQKTMVGVVVSDKMDKTVVVSVQRHRQHRLYGKTLRRTTRYKAHDPNNVCKLGDTVRLVETRPISKEKRWRVVEILQHKEVAEIRPAVIGQEIERPEVEAEESPATTDVVAEAEEVAETEEPVEAETER
jgi:small subunit ribosomal protein S17